MTWIELRCGEALEGSGDGSQAWQIPVRYRNEEVRKLRTRREGGHVNENEELAELEEPL